MAQAEVQNSDEELSSHLQAAVDRNRSTLEEAAACPSAQTWLRPRLATPEGTYQVYSALERVVSGPSFLLKLASFRRERQKGASSDKLHGSEVSQPGWWENPESGSRSTDEPEYQEVRAEDVEETEPLDSYVVVEKADVLEAIGTFVAAYLAELPEAQNLQPAELQVAIKHAFKELKKSRVRQLWGWGRAIYRCLAFSYGAFSVYENPWLVRAVLAAIWTASRMMVGLLI